MPGTRAPFKAGDGWVRDVPGARAARLPLEPLGRARAAPAIRAGARRCLSPQALPSRSVPNCCQLPHRFHNLAAVFFASLGFYLLRNGIFGLLGCALACTRALRECLVPCAGLRWPVIRKGNIIESMMLEKTSEKVTSSLQPNTIMSTRLWH